MERRLNRASGARVAHPRRYGSVTFLNRYPETLCILTLFDLVIVVVVVFFFCRIFIFHFYLSFLGSPLVKPPWMPSANAFFISLLLILRTRTLLRISMFIRCFVVRRPPLLSPRSQISYSLCCVSYSLWEILWYYRQPH